MYPGPNFKQFGVLQFLRPDLPKKHFGWSIRTNVNLRIICLK